MGYKLVSIVSSDKPGKKLKAIFQDKETGRTKTTHFGQATADDFTKTGDTAQRARYRQRHAKDLKGDPTKAGYLAMFVLWGNSTSIRDNISAYKSRFNL